MKFILLFTLNVGVNFLATTLLKEVLGKKDFSNWGVYLYIIFFFFSWFIMLGYLIKDNKRENGFKIGLTLLKKWLLAMLSLVAISFVFSFLI